MWFSGAPEAVLGLAALALLPAAAAKPFPGRVVPVHHEELRQLHNASQIERRDCVAPSFLCGYYSQLCCPSGSTCGLNDQSQAACLAGTAQQGGYVLSTIVVTETGLITRTSVVSVPVVAATPTGSCAASQQCGSACCGAGYYCKSAGTCAAVGGGPTPGIVSGTLNPSAPLRPTQSTLIVITATGSATATLPFATPIPTGASGTPMAAAGGGGGLGGGAIAGIVIGVLLGIALLLLICFYCCAKAAFDSILALFGLGKRRRRTHEETTYIEEHHHGGSAAGGRRWYGQGAARPSRPAKNSGGGGMGNLLGIGAGLAGLAAVLGMRRKKDKRHDDKSTTVTDSSYYYSDYTSESSASSDRRTRNTRRSSSRR